MEEDSDLGEEGAEEGRKGEGQFFLSLRRTKP
jgi:hypothetical protein